jgi:hypothetical protein
VADATDDFNRANAGSLGAGWTDFAFGSAGTLTIVSNQCVAVGNDALAYINGTFDDDQVAEFDLVSTGGATWTSLMVRASGSGATPTAYIAYIQAALAGTILIRRVVAGTDTGIYAGANGSGELVDGVRIGMRVAGDVITLTADGVDTVHTVSDPGGIASGNPGMGLYNGFIADNFLGGPLAGAGPGGGALSVNINRNRLRPRSFAPGLAR